MGGGGGRYKIPAPGTLKNISPLPLEHAYGQKKEARKAGGVGHFTRDLPHHQHLSYCAGLKEGGCTLLLNRVMALVMLLTNEEKVTMAKSNTPTAKHRSGAFSGTTSTSKAITLKQKHPDEPMQLSSVGAMPPFTKLSFRYDIPLPIHERHQGHCAFFIDTALPMQTGENHASTGPSTAQCRLRTDRLSQLISTPLCCIVISS